MRKYKTIIAGSRAFNNYQKLKEHCDTILRMHLEDEEVEVIIVSGGARGADRLGELYAQERGLAVDCHPADWQKYGRSAGIIRNKEMADSADALIAFLMAGEANKGTMNMINPHCKECSSTLIKVS